MGIVLFIALIAIGYVFYKYYRDKPSDSSFGGEQGSSVDIAKERYARGEISREEFERLKEDIS